MKIVRFILGALLFGSVQLPVAASAPDLAAQLAALAPDLSARVLSAALQARDCAVASGAAEAQARLAVIDYSLPSTQPRLWVFDLAQPSLLFSEHVAHGRGSGENLAQRFSNVEGSHQTSLGLFRTAETYQGGNGYSLRLDGLEPGTNDRARARAIVMHGAPYVAPALAQKQGRLGRSFGCPAVRSDVARPMIDTLRDGQLLFAWYPDPAWQQRSFFLNCPATTLARLSAPSAAPATAASGAPSTGPGAATASAK